MAGRKRHTDSVFPLQGKVTGGYPPVWKSGRGSLASSHAGTRLPIAVTIHGGWSYGPDTGRSPSVRSRLGRDAGVTSSTHSFRSKALKKQAPWRACHLGSRDDSLRWHGPHQVKGSKRLLPLSPGAPLSFALLWHRNTGLSRPFFGKTGLDKRKTAAYTVPRKGVLGRGLRGGCIPSTSPDLGNANVGMRRKTDIFPHAGGVFFVGLRMNGRLSRVSPLRGSSAFFNRHSCS